uniref:Uncharacterized protein n=1 Tax=Rhizophora mucronata TaxID=61149 RepID=A0A2P2KYG6_RHIMU
MVDLKVTLV